jgi:hypothetical protein
MHRKLLFLIAHITPIILLAQYERNDSSRTAADSKWAFSATGFYYIIPNDRNYLTMIGYADHGALHLEARYNYEDQRTASIFAGWRFETGNKLVFGATPMIGVVFGQTNGIAPGVELDLSYKIFDIYSESEYLIDFEGKENNYFYTWSELGIRPFQQLRTGITVQRTRLYQTALDVQRGIFAEYDF